MWFGVDDNCHDASLNTNLVHTTLFTNKLKKKILNKSQKLQVIQHAACTLSDAPTLFLDSQSHIAVRKNLFVHI